MAGKIVVLVKSLEVGEAAFDFVLQIGGDNFDHVEGVWAAEGYSWFYLYSMYLTGFEFVGFEEIFVELLAF